MAPRVLASRRGESILQTSPLGKYAEAVTAGAAGLIIVVTVGVHAWAAIAAVTLNTAFLDNLALLAVGVLFGSRAAANGAKEAIKPMILSVERDVQAAHTRLDEAGAPPAGGELPERDG